MFWKKFAKDYLSFSRQDRMGVIALSLMILAVIFIPSFFSKDPGPPRISSVQLSWDSLQSETEPFDFAEQVKPVAEENIAGELFYFDPNSLDAAGWERLGMKKNLVKTILNYRSKGGRFRSAEDLKKIWGMKEEVYQRIAPFARIAHDPAHTREAFVPVQYQQRRNTPEFLDLNSSDSAALESLPGIGPKLSSRIISYRNSLGGFYSVEQLGETYGLADSVFQKIKQRLVISGEVSKIKINSATKEELKKHPYIRWKLANALVSYREQHGSFRSAADLEKLLILDDEAIRKLLPYISFE